MDLHKAIAINDNQELENLILSKAAKNFYKREAFEKFDLFPFYAILVSSGTNKNTDHFHPIELIKAKNSPLDKPVNIGHNQKRIIGHITDCICVGEDLKPLPEKIDEGDIPERLHIVISAVIYKIWEDPAVQAEVNQIIDKISKGQTYVSMEALFKSFSYLLTSASGERKIIPRNEKTSGLTKYLRQYKGPGKIHDYTLARILEQITFSAVGIVDKPANVDSIISSDLDLFSNNNALANVNESVYINIEHSTNGENNMSNEVVNAAKDEESEMDSLKCEIETLKKDNASLHTLVAELNVKLEKPTKAETDTDQDTDKEMAELKSTIASLNEKVTSIENEKTTLVKANDDLNATVDAFKKASRHSERAEEMIKADSTLTLEKAREKVQAFDELSDTSFTQMVEMMKGYASRSPKEVTPESIINTAKADQDPPMGANAGDEFQKTVADIKKFLSPKKASTKE